MGTIEAFIGGFIAKASGGAEFPSEAPSPTCRRQNTEWAGQV